MCSGSSASSCAATHPMGSALGGATCTRTQTPWKHLGGGSLLALRALPLISHNDKPGAAMSPWHWLQCPSEWQLPQPWFLSCPTADRACAPRPQLPLWWSMPHSLFPPRKRPGIGEIQAHFCWSSSPVTFLGQYMGFPACLQMQAEAAASALPQCGCS